MRLFWTILVATALLSVVALANKSPTLDRTRLTTNIALAQLIGASHKHNLLRTEVCLTNIGKEDREVLSKANRCVCQNTLEMAFLEKIPMRRVGLNAACRDPTTIPLVNVHDVMLDLRKMCAEEGFNQRWAFCVLF